MDQNTIAAGIVLYNPDDEDRLKKCIGSILNQVDRLYIFDNSTEPCQELSQKDIIYISNIGNKGIAYALNQILETAYRDGISWVVTLDQDSILPEGMISAFKQEIYINRELGIICPQVIDLRRTYMIPKIEPDKEFIDFCITSGSCISVEVWKKLQGFDEWLFIDLVDNEFCKRLICSGYKILRMNSFLLNQEFGKIIPKSASKQRFWIKLSQSLHNKNFAKFSYKKIVSSVRVYYTHRNIIYINRKLKKYGSVGYIDNYNCKGFLGFLISFSIPSFLRAQDRLKVLKAIICGIYDGVNAKVPEWESGVSKYDE